MKYTYIGITQEPNIYTKKDGAFVSGIYFDVWNGAMINKSIVGTKWENQTLEITMDGELTVEDKILLDGVVANNLVKPTDSTVSVDELVDPVSPSGAKFKIGVDDDGILFTEELS